MQDSRRFAFSKGVNPSGFFWGNFHFDTRGLEFGASRWGNKRSDCREREYCGKENASGEAVAKVVRSV